MIGMRFHAFGGPEVLQREELPLPEPGQGQAQVRLEAIGVNFHDTYVRSGLYQVSLPHTPGIEAAGVVTAVGPGVTAVKPGDRVAYALGGGTYAEYGVTDAERLVPVPDGVSSEAAAALLVQGLTAHYLATSTFPLRPGHRVLVHAAAGGTGLLLIQIARRMGATVYGTAGSQAKVEKALAAGASAVINYNEQDFVSEVLRLTDGEGVDAVYDSVGKSTFAGSLRCLSPRGCLVSFGQSSGAVEPVAPLTLMNHGSLYLTRPHLRDYIRTRAELLGRAADIFHWAAAGELAVQVDSRFALAEAAEAHRRLESRQSTGKIILMP